jgi:hypothetical protein
LAQAQAPPQPHPPPAEETDADELRPEITEIMRTTLEAPQEGQVGDASPIRCRRSNRSPQARQVNS